MKGHLTDRDLATHLSGLLEGADRRVAAHLLECRECRARRDVMRAWMAPRFAGAPRPSKELEERILETRHRVEREPLPSRTARNVLRIALPAAAAAAVVAAVLLFVPRQEKPRYGEAFFSVGETAGEARVNGAAAAKGARIARGAVIATGPRATLRMRMGDSLSILLFPGSRLTVNEALKRLDTRATVLTFSLPEGSLVSNIEGGAGISYEYVTKTARITSSGTEFYIEAAPDRTKVVMRSGSVWITSLATGEKIKTRSGAAYTVEKEIIEHPAKKDDLALFDAGAAEKLAPPEEKEPARKIAVPKKKKKPAVKKKVQADRAEKDAEEEKAAREAARRTAEAKALRERREELERERTRREDVHDMRDLRNMRREKR